MSGRSTHVPTVLNSGTVPPPFGSWIAGPSVASGPSSPRFATPGPTNPTHVMSIVGA